MAVTETPPQPAADSEKKDKPVAPLPANADRQLETQTPVTVPDTTLLPTASEKAAEPAVAPVAESAAVAPQSLAERIAATDQWLNSTPETHYFIQLLSTDGNNERGIEIFLEKVSKSLDPTQIRVYRSRLSGRERLGVIYGDFPTRELALAELAKRAPTGAGINPYIRTVSKLR